MIAQLILQVKKDCKESGRGRKKWWADNLKIPPLTLSHWLAGRQKPDGSHALAIRDILEQMDRDQAMPQWEQYLWNLYYKRWPVPVEILGDIVLGVLSQSTVNSRSLALLSLLVDREKVDFRNLRSDLIKNRVGWLLEVSKKSPPFKPIKALKTQFLLTHSAHSPNMQKYYLRFQTAVGKKWKICDCDLNEMKHSLL